jgi:hypothetical protein
MIDVPAIPTVLINGKIVINITLRGVQRVIAADLKQKRGMS